MNNTNKPIIAKTDEQILACFPVLLELRPNLQEQHFLGLIRGMQKDGYQLAYIQTDQQAVAAAGFRIYTNLFMGRHLYVDDLVTSSEQRSQAYGEKLIQWLRQLALDSECNFFHLDSGTQRYRAHKFYLNQGFDIESYHFSQELGSKNK